MTIIEERLTQWIPEKYEESSFNDLRDEEEEVKRENRANLSNRFCYRNVSNGKWTILWKIVSDEQT